MLTEAIVANKALIGAGAFAILFAAERAFAAAPAAPDPKRLFKNAALWAMLLLFSPAITLPLTAFASAHPVWARAGILLEPAMLAVDLILLDLWTYWLHRAYHEIPAIRRFHRVHHLDERLDTTSAVRFHPGEVALSAALRLVPITLLAIPFSHVVLFETVLLAASLFHHSNVRLPPAFERGLSRIIVTPSIHWVHHHAVPADTNSNYAAIFSFWDPLFGSRAATARTPTMKIGLEGVEDKSLIGLLLAPFKATEKR